MSTRLRCVSLCILALSLSGLEEHSTTEWQPSEKALRFAVALGASDAGIIAKGSVLTYDFCGFPVRELKLPSFQYAVRQDSGHCVSLFVLPPTWAVEQLNKGSSLSEQAVAQVIRQWDPISVLGYPKWITLDTSAIRQSLSADGRLELHRSTKWGKFVDEKVGMKFRYSGDGTRVELGGLMIVLSLDNVNGHSFADFQQETGESEAIESFKKTPLYTSIEKTTGTILSVSAVIDQQATLVHANDFFNVTKLVSFICDLRKPIARTRAVVLTIATSKGEIRALGYYDPVQRIYPAGFPQYR